MARFVAKIDVSDWNDLIEYVAGVAHSWPDKKREALRRDMLAAINRGIDVVPEQGGFLAQPNHAIFAVLNRYGLNPVV